MPGGRPPKEYKPEYAEMLKDHMSKGFSFESFAGLIGCSKDALYAMADRNPEFSDAKREAFELSRFFWERLAVENAVEYNIPGEGSRKLNTAAWVFNMKNRFGWRDQVDQNITQQSHNVNLNARVNLENLSEDELDMLTKLVDKMGGASAKN